MPREEGGESVAEIGPEKFGVFGAEKCGRNGGVRENVDTEKDEAGSHDERGQDEGEAREVFNCEAKMRLQKSVNDNKAGEIEHVRGENGEGGEKRK